MISSGLLQVRGNFRIYEPGTAPDGQVFPTPKPDVDGKFAPPTGRALLLIGQSAENVDAYFDATVTAPGGVSLNTSLQLNVIDELNYLAEKYPKSALSVGIDLNDSIDEVAAGNASERIDALLDILTAYNRPVYLRLGSGFDDPANTFGPDAYVSAWKKFHERIQTRGSENVALVWESISCEESNIAEWYPGDGYVDWVGAPYCDRESIGARMQFAREHFKPVLVTVAPPTADVDWNAWFAPFFKFVMDNNDVVRAVTYINEEGSHIGLNAYTLKKWKDETKQTFWLRGGPQLFDSLSK